MPAGFLLHRSRASLRLPPMRVLGAARELAGKVDRLVEPSLLRYAPIRALPELYRPHRAMNASSSSWQGFPRSSLPDDAHPSASWPAPFLTSAEDLKQACATLSPEQRQIVAREVDRLLEERK